MTDTLVPQALKASDLTELLKSLTDAKPDASKAVETASKAPSPVKVTETALQALESLSELLSAVAVPSERREATPSERDDMMKLANTAKEVVPAVNAAVDAVKEAIFNHFDVEIEKLGATPEKDKYGHYLVKQEVIVPEQGKRFTRELREQSPTVTAKALRELWKSRKITREDYFSATKHVDVPREVVNDQLMDLLKRKPQLLSVIKEAITPGDVTSAFYVRDMKKDSAKK